jgi:Tol biopolymer transport system component
MRNSFLLPLFIIILTACSTSLQKATITPTFSPSEIPTSTPSPTPLTVEQKISPIVYIDEDLPGPVPERFGEEFFSGSFHSAPVFAPDGKTVWWGGEYGSATIYTSQYSSEGWTEPTTIRFSESIASYRDPFISPDGAKFYFISTAALPGISSSSKEKLWMMALEDGGWGEPMPLPDSINALALHWTVSVANNYDLYFSAQEEGNTDIFFSRYQEGVYTDPIKLEAPVNTEGIEITPNIAPDGSYLLFTRSQSRGDSPHLYITYAEDSGWTEPVRIENVPYCISPIVTPDRAYVIFLSSPSSFSWRDTSFIEELRSIN